jgi:hypothetical protein
MKNSYLFLSLCFGILSGSAVAQNAYVAGNQKVKVNPNTLFYFGGDLTVNAAASADKVVENAGNVKVNGQFVNNGSATGANFVSTWTNQNNYGQVIINQASSVNRLSMEKGVINPADFEWGQFAIPYAFATANDAMNALFGANYVQSSRYYSSMMVWDNTSKPEFDHLLSASPLSPGDYVILNLKYYSGNIKGLMETDADGKLLYPGLPTNGAFSKNIDPTIYPTGNWSDWKELKNSHNEKYRTYIDDKLRNETTNDANFGKYHFQYGNPYTSNITLAHLGTSLGYDDGNNIANLAGVGKVNKTVWSFGSGNNASASTMLIAKYDAGANQWSGSAEALIVKPFEPFFLILEDGATGTRQINFSDKLKTFSMNPGVSVMPAPPVAPLQNNSDLNSSSSEIADRIINNSGNDNSATFSSKKFFYQAELSLYNSDGNFTGNRAYIVASNLAKNGIDSKLESEYSDFEGRSGFYLAQENAQGEIVESSARKMHINAIGLNYTNKPIPFFFNRTSGDTNTYTLKSDLYFFDIFSKLSNNEGNYEDGNSFFFYDSLEDVLLPITTDFSYDIVYTPENEVTRYRLYWNATNVGGRDQMDTKDLIASSTVIYKDNTTHKVRFNENWDVANTLKVYDLSGRKVMEYSNVKTDVDFEINLPSKGIYVVKIESNTGDVYTQKIVK